MAPLSIFKFVILTGQISDVVVIAVFNVEHMFSVTSNTEALYSFSQARKSTQSDFGDSTTTTRLLRLSEMPNRWMFVFARMLNYSPIKATSTDQLCNKCLY